MAGYGADEDFAAYLVANGLTLPDGAPTLSILREQGSVFIDGQFGARFSGYPTGGFAQERAWPRTGACAFGAEIPDNVIPVAVENASYAAGYQAAIAPGSLSAVATATGAVKRKRIEGAVEIEYFEGDGTVIENATVRIAVVEGLLAPFFSVSFGSVLLV